MFKLPDVSTIIVHSLVDTWSMLVMNGCHTHSSVLLDEVEPLDGHVAVQFDLSESRLPGQASSLFETDHRGQSPIELLCVGGKTLVNVQ